MRFNDYFQQRLDEKVNKQEFDDALNNSNIYVGAEFEFICEDLANWDGSEDLQDMYDEAYRAWEEYDSIHSDWEENQSNLQDKIDTLSEEQSNLDDEDEDYDDEYERLQNEIDDIENQMGEGEPEIESAYYDYISEINNRFGMSYDDGEPGNYSEPPDPEQFTGNTADEENWMQAVEELFDEIFKQCPIRYGNINVVADSKGYGQKPGDKVWLATFDSSIAQDGGIEFVSPPMPLPEFLAICPKIFTWIQQQGGTNNNCGFHVHLSIDGVRDLKSAMDPIKLSMMVDEGIIWKHFEGREFSDYCRSTKKTLAQRGLTGDDIGKLVNKQKLNREIRADHFHSINFEHFESGRIEFRQMGGDNYHKKWTQVRQIMAMYSYAMSAACDPKYKQQEYMVRVARLANKIDNMKLNRYITWLEEAIYTLNKQVQRDGFEQAKKAITMEIANVKRSIVGALPGEYEEQAFRNNREWVDGVETYCKNRLTELMQKTKIKDGMKTYLGLYVI